MTATAYHDRDIADASIEAAAAAIAEGIHSAAGAATKADLAALRAATRADRARALWLQAAALVATQVATAGFVVYWLGP